jgi:hypothetical protein
MEAGNLMPKIFYDYALGGLAFKCSDFGIVYACALNHGII